MISRFVALVVLCSIATTTARAVDPVPVVTREFKLSSILETKLMKDDMTATFLVDCTYKYAWQCAGKERTLLLREMALQTKLPDSKIKGTTMNRVGVTSTEEGKITKSVMYDDLPENRKKVVRELFDSPLCKLEVDDSGKVTKRTDTAGATIKQLAVDNGMLSAFTLLHPPYQAGKDKWQVDTVFSISETAGEVAGTLEYAKVVGGKGGQMVNVTGTLKADIVKGKGGGAMKNVKWIVTGTQTYDLDRKEWVTGKLDIDMSSDLIEEGKDFATQKGKNTMTFEMLPEKKR